MSASITSQARKKTQVIRSSFDPDHMRGQDIDNKIVELRCNSGKDIYIVDEKHLKRVCPDLIVAQGLCEVCSPFTKEINRAVSLLGDHGRCSKFSTRTTLMIYLSA